MPARVTGGRAIGTVVGVLRLAAVLSVVVGRVQVGRRTRRARRANGPNRGLPAPGPHPARAQVAAGGVAVAAAGRSPVRPVTATHPRSHPGRRPARPSRSDAAGVATSAGLALTLAALALATGALATADPAALFLLLLVPLAFVLTRPAGRLVVVFVGALLVFQSSASVGLPKLAFLAVFLLCGAVSAVRVHQLFVQEWAVPFKPVVVVGVAYLGYLVLTAVVATGNGTPPASWLRDVVAYALLAVAPLLAVDAASTMSIRATKRFLVALALVVPAGFSADWLSRRGASGLPVQRFILATIALPIVLFAYVLVRAATGPHRPRWLLLTLWIPTVLLFSGTRTVLVFGLGLLGLVGNQAKVRLGSIRVVALAGLLVGLGTSALWWLAGATGQSRFLGDRAESVTRLFQSQADASAVLRRRAYAYTLEAIQSSPLLGTGPGHLFPSVEPGQAAGLTLDSPLLVTAKFGLVGTVALAAFLGSIVVTFHRVRLRSGWTAAGTTGRVTAVVLLALAPFGAIVEDKGFVLAVLLILLLLGATARDAGPGGGVTA